MSGRYFGTMYADSIYQIMEITLDFTEYTDDTVVELRIRIDAELKKRSIKFSVGDWGEIVAIKHFNDTPRLPKLQKAPIGTKNVDALSRSGDRYSIKTIKDGSKTGTVYPDPEDKDRQLFEYMVIVLLDDFYELNALYRFSWKQFLEIRLWDKTMNAWYVSASKKALSMGETIYIK